MNFEEIARKSGASQDNFEMGKMMEIIAHQNPKKILEIGVHTGNGLKAFAQAFPQAELFGIECDIQYLQFKDFNLIEGSSTDPKIIKKAESIGPYDFIFIDGDHTYEGVKADWLNYKYLVAPGGVVGFHDTSRTGEGWMSKVEVRKLLEEIWRDYSYKCIEIWNGRNNPGTALIWV